MYEGFGTPETAFPTWVDEMADEYGELVKHLNDQDAERPVRKTHRLYPECYAGRESKYFFTLCARDKGTPFADHRLADKIVESLLWCRKRYGWILFCYCLMLDHLHLVMAAYERQDCQSNAGARGIVEKGILEEIGEFKSYTTRIWWKHGGQGPLWQKSSYDHIFRYSESVQAAAWYVLNNPVRKGLVENWEQYPYSAIVDSWE